MTWECEPPPHCPDGGAKRVEGCCQHPSFGSAGACLACHELWPMIIELRRDLAMATARAKKAEEKVKMLEESRICDDL